MKKIYYENKGFIVIDNTYATGALHPKDKWLLPEGNYNFYVVDKIYYFTGVLDENKNK